MPDFDLTGDVDAPSTSAIPSADEQAIPGADGEDRADPNEPLAIEEEAKEYFNSVTDEEALNYIMFLRDANAISFDRLNQLKELLDQTPSFLPEGY